MFKDPEEFAAVFEPIPFVCNFVLTFGGLGSNLIYTDRFSKGFQRASGFRKIRVFFPGIGIGAA